MLQILFESPDIGISQSIFVVLKTIGHEGDMNKLCQLGTYKKYLALRDNTIDLNRALETQTTAVIPRCHKN